MKQIRFTNEFSFFLNSLSSLASYLYFSSQDSCLGILKKDFHIFLLVFFCAVIANFFFRYIYFFIYISIELFLFRLCRLRAGG